MIAPNSSSWPDGWLQPDLGSGTRAVMTARAPLDPQMVSQAPYDAFNLGLHVADDAATVRGHRRALEAAIGAKAVWLEQVHGNRVVRLSAGDPSGPEPLRADGSLTTEAGLACVIMVADCLPILLAAPDGRGVAALHAGWRGLAGAGEMQGHGVVEEGVSALCEATSCAPSELRAWLGPCIGPAAFEVDADVLAGFGVDPAQPHPRFSPRVQGGESGGGLGGGFDPAAPDARWTADLAGLARDRLRAGGLSDVTGGHWCTVSEASRFFSFRRQRVTGRQAAAIWIGPR